MGKRGRLKKYQEHIKCPECVSNWCKKFGKNTGKQRYKCNECGRHFYEGAKYHKHPEKVKLLDLPKKLCNQSSKFSSPNLTFKICLIS